MGRKTESEMQALKEHIQNLKQANPNVTHSEIAKALNITFSFARNLLRESNGQPPITRGERIKKQAKTQLAEKPKADVPTIKGVIEKLKEIIEYVEAYADSQKKRASELFL